MPLIELHVHIMAERDSICWQVNVGQVVGADPRNQCENELLGCFQNRQYFKRDYAERFAVAPVFRAPASQCASLLIALFYRILERLDTLGLDFRIFFDDPLRRRRRNDGFRGQLFDKGNSLGR